MNAGGELAAAFERFAVHVHQDRRAERQLQIPDADRLDARLTIETAHEDRRQAPKIAEQRPLVHQHQIEPPIVQARTGRNLRAIAVLP